MTFGPHVTPTINCQHYADRLLVSRRAGEWESFRQLACEAIAKVGPHVSRIAVNQMADSWWRDGFYQPEEWRRNVALTLERIRQGWG